MKTIIAFLLMSATLGASDVRFPTRTVSVPSEPVQEIRIEVVTTLPIGELYIVESDSELMIRQFPEGLLNVREIAPGGIRPMGIDGLFAGGDREGETRVFSAAHIYSFRGVKPGKVQVDVIPKGTLIQTEADAPLLVLTVSGSGPQPPPGPEPDVDPDIDPPKPPGPVTSFRVIFVKESGDTLNAQQSAIPVAKAIRDYVNAKTTPDGGQPGWREYDPNQNTTNEPEMMQKLWAAVLPKLTPPPCMVVEVNGHATVMPFPANVAECLATLKKHGGS